MGERRNMGSSGDGSAPLVSVTRIETFSACHRLHSPFLSDEENRELYGKCNNPNGHGHNYKLEYIIFAVEVTLRGEVDPTTGMVINITDVKQLIKESPATNLTPIITAFTALFQDAIMDVLDHKNIDEDVPYFKDKVSTTENIAIFVWHQLREVVPPRLQLFVKIHETDKNVVTYPS
ncbi:6-pyruvoyl tetrahydrobiopterin synthase-like isoform X1 [Ornithodoros turicata]|uniref:6-pyruvoyl tetrahydrobiopterin synthase-like isoform X1 n=1 Tax=Ornithodoros turicata TaxID=34597 RepID=UPI00313A1EA2